MALARLRDAFSRLSRSLSISSPQKALASIFLAAAIATPVTAHDVDHDVSMTPANDHAKAPNLVIRGSDTDYSRRMKELQNKFGKITPNVRVVMMDKDWFQQNFTLNGGTVNDNAVDDDEQKLIRTLMSVYVGEKSDLHFTSESYETMEPAALNGAGVAYMRRYQIQGGHAVDTDDPSKNQYLCMVFAHRVNLSQDAQIKSFLALTPEVFGNLADAPLKDALSLDLLNRYTDIHEIGHCMDQWYLPNIPNPNNGDILGFFEGRHKAEVFAEVFATLMLAQEGHDLSFIEKRANFRLASAGLGGPVFAQATMMDPASQYMNYVYLLHKGVRNAGDEINKIGVPALQKMDIEQIRELAHQITERSTLSIKADAEAVMYMMTQAYDLTPWETLKDEYPHIKERYEIALALKADMEKAVRSVLNVGNRADPVLQPSTFNLKGVFMRQPVDMAQLRARVDTLATELWTRAGGRRATTDTLVSSYQAKKNDLRQDLLSSVPQTREQAMRDLSLMIGAFEKTVEKLPWYRKPAATRDQEPSPSAP